MFNDVLVIHVRGERTDLGTRQRKKAITDTKQAGLIDVPNPEDVIGESWIISAHSSGAVSLCTWPRAPATRRSSRPKAPPSRMEYSAVCI